MRVGIGTSPLEPRSEPKKKDNFPITMLGWMGYIGWMMLFITLRRVREWMSGIAHPYSASVTRLIRAFIAEGGEVAAARERQDGREEAR